MKTEKFTISFTGIDTALSKEITISKKEYQSQFAFLMRQVKETAENEYPMEYRAFTYDRENVLLTMHVFTVGTADTTLIAYSCKPGFVFKK